MSIRRIVRQHLTPYWYVANLNIMSLKHVPFFVVCRYSYTWLSALCPLRTFCVLLWTQPFLLVIITRSFVNKLWCSKHLYLYVTIQLSALLFEPIKLSFHHFFTFREQLDFIYRLYPPPLWLYSLLIELDLPVCPSVRLGFVGLPRAALTLLPCRKGGAFVPVIWCSRPPHRTGAPWKWVVSLFRSPMFFLESLSKAAWCGWCFFGSLNRLFWILDAEKHDLLHLRYEYTSSELHLWSRLRDLTFFIICL